MIMVALFSRLNSSIIKCHVSIECICNSKAIGLCNMEKSSSFDINWLINKLLKKYVILNFYRAHLIVEKNIIKLYKN